MSASAEYINGMKHLHLTFTQLFRDWLGSAPVFCVFFRFRPLIFDVYEMVSEVTLAWLLELT